MALFYAILLGLSWIASDEIKAYIASTGLVVIPIGIGFSACMVVNKLRSAESTCRVNVRSGLTWWMTGIIFLTVSSSIASVVFPLLTMSIGAILGLFGIFFCVVWGRRANSSKLSLSKKSLLSVFVITIAVIAAFWYLRRLSTFPLMLGEDLTDHLADLGAISNGTKGIGLYDDAFILMIGIASSLAGAKALWLFWSGPLIQYAVMAIGIYLLSRKALSNYYAPIFAAVVPLWFMGDGVINDLIFFLRRNVLMALIPFFVLYLMLDDEKPRSKPSFAFLLSVLVPVIYYFGISNAFYISTVSRLPYILQALFQPGFLFTSPALTFGMPAANLQGFYIALISAVILYFLIRMSKPDERKTILSWSTVSFVAILINYRMGFMLSIIFFAFIILRSWFAFRAFSVVSLASLGFIGLTFAGFNFLFSPWLGNIYDIFTKIVLQNSGSIWSTQTKMDFLSSNYTQVLMYLGFFSIIYLSFAVTKRRIVSIITALAGLSLAVYFLPIPSSERFLVLFTPFTVLLILISVETLVKNNLNEARPRDVGKTNSNAKSAGLHRLDSICIWKARMGFHISSEKIIGVFALASLVVLSGFSLTGPYDSAIKNYTSMYAATGSISSFNQYDLQVADWLQEYMPRETLIISDPATIRILSGLAEMPYTLNGRYFVKGLDTLSMVSGKPDLFRNVLSSLSIDSLTELVRLFDNSDHITGLNSSNRRIVAIVNNRTTAWLKGSAGFEYSSSFHLFPGLVYLETSSFSKGVYNASATYLAFELKVPVLVTTMGPEVSVKYGNSTILAEAPVMTYYDIKNPNYTLTLSGSDEYTIQEIPVNWLLDSIQSPGVQMLNVTQSADGSYLKIAQAVPNNAVVVHWVSYAQFGGVAWKFVQWQNGWQAGSRSSSQAGLLQFTSVDGMLKLNLSSGVSGGYSSLYRTDLSLPLNNGTSLFIGVNGTQNTQLAVAIDLTEGRRIFLFNGTTLTFFPLQPQFQIIEHQLKLGYNSTITGIQIFIKSADGSSCESFIKYFFATQR